MDGTLVDSEKHYMIGTRRWLNDISIEISDENLHKIIGMTNDQACDYLSKITNLNIEEVDKLNAHYFNEIDKINYSNYLYDDVEDVLRKLKDKKIKSVICTGSERILIDRFIKNCGFDDLFELTLTSENYKPKPSPDIYLKAMEILHIKKEECIIVEDSSQGIKAAKAAGTYVYARDASRYNIDQSEADKIIEDLHEILEDI